MSVYRKPGSKYYWYGFVFRGERVQKSTKVTNKQEAKNIEKAAWVQLARGEVGIEDKPTPERKTVGQLLTALENDLKARKKGSPKNLNLIGVVRSDLGERWADTLTTAAVTHYVADLRKPHKSKRKGRRSKSLSDSTIKHRLQIMSQAFELENVARQEARLDPLAVPRFPDLSSGNVRQGFLTPGEFEALRTQLPEDLRDFAQFAYLTGWRRGAVAGLEWSDVHDGNVYLRGVLSKNGKPYFVPIIGDLVDLIERRKKARSVKVDSGVEVLSSLVFHRDGQPIVEFRKAWASACKRAAIGTRLFHDLRRSAARNLIRSGVSRNVAKTVGGWKTDSMFDRYNVTGEEDLRDAMEKATQYNETERKKVAAISNG